MQCLISISVQKYDDFYIDFGANSATVSAGLSRGASAAATEQMLAQQHVWRRSQLAALSAASLTGYIRYTCSIKSTTKTVKAKKSLRCIFTLKWPEDVRCQNTYLCQTVSIKNCDTTARRLSSRRVSEIPFAAICLISTLTKSWTLNILEKLESDFYTHCIAKQLCLENKCTQGKKNERGKSLTLHITSVKLFSFTVIWLHMTGNSKVEQKIPETKVRVFA